MKNRILEAVVIALVISFIVGGITLYGKVLVIESRLDTVFEIIKVLELWKK